jgi:membrane protein implicated in regulation of membrane protease activity
VFRTFLTLALIIGALILAVTPRGLALLGSNRSLLVAALVVLAVSQVYRLVSAWQARKRGDRLNRIPKRPLGI